MSLLTPTTPRASRDRSYRAGGETEHDVQVWKEQKWLVARQLQRALSLFPF